MPCQNNQEKIGQEGNPSTLGAKCAIFLSKSHNIDVLNFNFVINHYIRQTIRSRSNLSA